MFRFAYRQRRYILMIMLLCFYVTFKYVRLDDIDSSRYNGAHAHWIAPTAIILTAIILTIIYAVIFLGLAAIFPEMGGVIVIGGIFYISLAGYLYLYSLGFGENSDYWFESIMPILWLILMFLFLVSSTFDDILPRISRKRTRRFFSPKSAEDIWYNLALGKAPVEHHWDSLLREIEIDPNDPNTFMAKYAAQNGLADCKTIKYVVDNPFTHFKYEFFNELSQKYASFGHGTYEVNIQPLPTGGCTVSLTLYNNALFFRHALLHWFEDELGSWADHLHAVHNGKRDWSLAGKYRRKINKMV